MGFSRLFKKTTRKPKRSPEQDRFRPVLEGLESRLLPYTTSGNFWPHPELITLSFMPDGTAIGSETSNLFAIFNAKFGSPSTWENQILKAAQDWAQQTNINFAVVSDNGKPEGYTASSGTGAYQQGDPGYGDIRIGGYNFGTSTLAQAYLPPSVNNYSLAGDIQFNTGQTYNIGSTYDLFTVAMHEFGHALGLYHTTVTSADMYATYSSTKTGLASDDIAGIRAIYSNNNPRSPDPYDAAGSNGSFSSASNITSLINSSTKTALVTGLDITTTSDLDYYKFTAPAGGTGSLTVDVQSSGLSLLAPNLWVYGASQSQLAYASGYGHYGTTLTTTISGIVAGQTYYVKVAGADSTAFGTGAYALTLNLGTGSSPTVPLPNTQVLNGSPLTGGGGQAFAQAAEYTVNTTTAGVQQTFAESPQAVATDAHGNYVVVWGSYGQDGSGWGVYGQRFNAVGTPQGGEFRVNTTTVGDQMYPNVAMDAAGNFVVTWSSDGQDGSGWGIYGQIFSADGTPQGGEFKVNSTTAGDQLYSTVAISNGTNLGAIVNVLTATANSLTGSLLGVRLLSTNVNISIGGGFIVTWSSHGQNGSGWGIYAQMYSSAGTPIGSEFQVSTSTTGDHLRSDVAVNENGGFVISWSGTNADGSGWDVYARQYAANGSPVGDPFRVNTTTAGNQQHATVAMNAEGNFVVTWASLSSTGSWNVFGQQFSPLGAPVGPEFQVNTYTDGSQTDPTVAITPQGDFIITWSSYGQDGSGWGVYGQQYDDSGAPVGDPFLVNTTTAGDQRFSSVSVSNTGHIVVVWSGNGGIDTNGVFARRYVIGGDNLEPGSTSDNTQTATRGAADVSPLAMGFFADMEAATTADTFTSQMTNSPVSSVDANMGAFVWREIDACFAADPERMLGNETNGDRIALIASEAAMAWNDSSPLVDTDL